jgi:rhodanese-related sulfurtransferase
MNQRALKDISAAEAHSMLEYDAILVDVRETYEQAMERIPGALARPLSALARGEPINLPSGRAAVFLCASGARTRNNSAALAALAGAHAFCMSGGIAAWKRAGLPTERG